MTKETNERAPGLGRAFSVIWDPPDELLWGMQRYESLTAWQRAHDFALAVFKATEAWPRREWYGVAAQIRKSAYSVPANIAEGAAKKSRKEFRHHLDIAIGSLDETHYGLRFAMDLGFMDHATKDRLEALRVEASKCLWGLAKSVEGK